MTLLSHLKSLIITIIRVIMMDLVLTDIYTVKVQLVAHTY